MLGREHYFSIIFRRRVTIRAKINKSYERRTDDGTGLPQAALHSSDTVMLQTSEAAPPAYIAIRALEKAAIRV